MPVAALLFDLDDTLLAQDSADAAALIAVAGTVHEPSEGAALEQGIRSQARTLWYDAPTGAYCRTVGISPIEGLWARFEGDDPYLRALREWAPRYRQEVWGRSLNVAAPEAERLAALFRTERQARQELFPETCAVLAALRPHYRLALITNGAPDLQREKLAHSGLAGEFEAITISGDHGIGKPDARIFAYTLQTLRVTPEAAVMIGNSLAHDIAGAHNAGIRNVWIDRPGSTPQESVVRPDRVIASLTELQQLLAHWS